MHTGCVCGRGVGRVRGVLLCGCVREKYWIVQRYRSARNQRLRPIWRTPRSHVAGVRGRSHQQQVWHNVLSQHSDWASSNRHWHMTYSAKRCSNGGSDFWLSISPFQTLCLVVAFGCAFIIGQYHSGNNNELQIWSSWRNIIIWKWKAPRNSTPENGHAHGECFRRCLHSLTFSTTMTNQNITAVTDLHRGDISLHSAYKIDYH